MATKTARNRPGPGRRPAWRGRGCARGPAGRPSECRARPVAAMARDPALDGGGPVGRLWGLAFLLLGVLAGLGIYAEVIGPAGHVLRTGTGDLLGLARYGLPPAFAVLGGYLILRHARSEPGRVAVGLALAILSAAGLLEVIAGNGTLHEPVQKMGQAGGLVGAGEGVPLQAGVGSWGAGLVLGAVLFVSALVITATPARAVAGDLRSFGTAPPMPRDGSGHVEGPGPRRPDGWPRPPGTPASGPRIWPADQIGGRTGHCPRLSQAGLLERCAAGDEVDHRRRRPDVSARRWRWRWGSRP